MTKYLLLLLFLTACAPQKEMGYAIIPQEYYPDPEIANYTEIEIYAYDFTEQMDTRRDRTQRKAHQRSGNAAK